MSKRNCNTCNKERQIKIGRLSRKVNEYVLNNCRYCRKKRYDKELVKYSWPGYPGGSEGNMLYLLLNIIKQKGYSEDHIDFVIIGHTYYKWDREAFNFAYFDSFGCAELLVINKLVMKDGSFYEPVDTDGEYQQYRLKYHRPPDKYTCLVDGLKDKISECLNK